METRAASQVNECSWTQFDTMNYSSLDLMTPHPSLILHTRMLTKPDMSSSITEELERRALSSYCPALCSKGPLPSQYPALKLGEPESHSGRTILLPREMSKRITHQQIAILLLGRKHIKITPCFANILAGAQSPKELASGMRASTYSSRGH